MIKLHYVKILAHDRWKQSTGNVFWSFIWGTSPQKKLPVFFQMDTSFRYNLSSSQDASRSIKVTSDPCPDAKPILQSSVRNEVWLDFIRRRTAAIPQAALFTVSQQEEVLAGYIPDKSHIHTLYVHTDRPTQKQCYPVLQRFFVYVGVAVSSSGVSFIFISLDKAVPYPTNAINALEQERCELQHSRCVLRGKDLRRDDTVTVDKTQRQCFFPETMTWLKR